MTLHIRDFAKTLPDFLVNFEDFTIIKTIGRGGFGEVYLAEHKATGILCALKKLTLSEEEFEGQHEKYFIREVDILSKTQNPFLLRLLGFSDHYPFCIATEYITRGSLYNAVHHAEKAPVLDGTQLTIIALIVAIGIQSLHEKKIVHRDIKTLNILLDDNLLPHICDFGISRELTDDLQGNSQEAGPVTGDIGTPNWMAPELFNTTGYDFKVDVYAYGIMLWEMVTGAIPFDKMPPFKIMNEVMNGGRPKIPENTPSRLRSLISSCWAQNPQDRPTFDMIVKALKKHKVEFPGTNPARVDEVINSLKNQGPTPITQATSHRGQAPAREFSRLIEDPQDPNYESAVISAINSITPDKFLKLLQIIMPQFPVVPKKETVSKILEKLEFLMSSKPQFAEIFINQQGFNSLPYNIPECIPACNRVFEALFAGETRVVTQQLIDFAFRLCQTSPVTSLNSLANYIYQLDAPYTEYSIRYLITLADYYSVYETSELLVDTLFYYASHNPQYQYNPNIYQVIEKQLNSSNERTVDAAYRAIIELHINDFTVPTDMLIKHLRFKSLVLSVLLYLSSLPQNLKVTPDLITAVLEYASTDQLAVFVICLFAERNDTAIELVNAWDKWLSSPFLPIADSVRIFLALMCNLNMRPHLAMKIPQLSSFFRLILDSRDQELIENIGPVIRRLDQYLTDEFLKDCTRSKFLGFYLRQAVSLNSTDMVSSGLSIVECLSRKGYIPDYLEYVAYAVNFITQPVPKELKEVCVSFLYTLSRYPDTKPYLIQSNLQAALNSNYLSPELMNYANAIFQNIGLL